jgi:hypothetical protein
MKSILSITNPIIGVSKLLRSKLLLKFGYKYDKSVIPKGLYCYSISSEEFARMEREDWDGTYKINPCPYYVIIGSGWNGCKYRGCITDDMVFDDQCKICGTNYPDFNKEDTIPIEEWYDGDNIMH